MTETLIDRAPELALEWHKAGRRAALATVIETWGSAPRRAGAQLVIAGDGEMQGSVSGGCVEGAVVVEALEALEQGQARVLEYGVSDDDAFAVGLACGGTIRVLVEPVGATLSEDMLNTIVATRATRGQLAYVADLNSQDRTLVTDGYPARFAQDKSGVEEDGQTFVGIHNPPLRLAIVGGVHIAQALVPMARIAGYDPVIIDPREAFGAQSRFPDTKVINDWPDDALAEMGLDARTALVLLTHDPKIDDPALHLALKSKAFYIGALGSKRTHAKRVARLEGAGFSADEIARIHGPIGLNIGSVNPQEIAISVIAQMTQTLRQTK
ncbi:MAG: XdhC family protein [Paracoccaceae bacterium]